MIKVVDSPTTIYDSKETDDEGAFCELLNVLFGSYGTERPTGPIFVPGIILEILFCFLGR